VAGVGGLERGVGEALARAVSRDEVLEHREPLAEVRGDGSLDDFARRLGHQAAQARELANLLLGTARAGVGHDENRIERGPGIVSPLSFLPKTWVDSPLITALPIWSCTSAQ